ncbi:hypothetical protein Hanom_Chr00s000007g01615021 [Helianthus anomalus]
MNSVYQPTLLYNPKSSTIRTPPLPKLKRSQFINPHQFIFKLIFSSKYPNLFSLVEKT